MYITTDGSLTELRKVTNHNGSTFCIPYGWTGSLAKAPKYDLHGPKPRAKRATYQEYMRVVYEGKKLSPFTPGISVSVKI